MTPERPIVKTYAVPSPLLQEMINYLQTKPWHEVNGMIMAVMQIVQAETNAQQSIVMPNVAGNGRDTAQHQEASKHA